MNCIPEATSIVLTEAERTGLEGLVRSTKTEHRCRRVEFLDFMNRVVAEHPGREIHVILDNLNTHKPKNDRWLKRHANIHFHFTPTKASWLNQIEIRCSILSAKALTGTSFNSRNELMAHINAFIKAYNVDAKPFLWIKSEVHQKRLKPCFAG